MAIAAVGGNNNNSAVGVTTLTVNYTPTNGNIVVVFFVTSGNVTNLVVKDNVGGGVALNAGPTQGTTTCWYYTVAGGPTAFTATWTGSQQASIAVEEYSGAAGVDSNFANFHNSGNSASATISITLLQGNDWIVCGLGAANTITATTGNQRQQTTASAARITIVDNTAGTPISVTCAGSLTSTNWAAVGVILGGAGQAIALQEVALAVESVYSKSEVRTVQEVALVVVDQTNSKATVSQEVVLVLASNNRLRQLAVRKIITAWRKRPKKHAIQIPIGYQLHGARKKRPYTSVIT